MTDLITRLETLAAEQKHDRPSTAALAAEAAAEIERLSGMVREAREGLKVPDMSYPVVIVQDRYGGIYSRGSWLAVDSADRAFEGTTRAAFVLDDGPSGGDGEAMAFWFEPPPWIAVGSTPDLAARALIAKLEGQGSSWDLALTNCSALDESEPVECGPCNGTGQEPSQSDLAKRSLFGPLIIRRRTELGLSLQDVAVIAECSKAHVWEMEQGRTQNPSVGTLMGLSRALQLTPNDMFAAAVRSWGMIGRSGQ